MVETGFANNKAICRKHIPSLLYLSYKKKKQIIKEINPPMFLQTA